MAESPHRSRVEVINLMMAAITPGQRRQNEPSGRGGRFIRDAASFPKVLFVLSDEVDMASLFKVDSNLLNGFAGCISLNKVI